jgi:hypothetical protein
MVSSDALSRRPDHCPEEDKTKEKILLPDDLFLNLLDVDLRDRITKNKEYNFDVTKAIELLQEEGLTSIQNNLEDWKIEEVLQLFLSTSSFTLLFFSLPVIT